MTWLEFISSVLSSIIWPATVMLVVILLRGPLVELIPLLKRLKVRDIEIEFGAGLERAKAVAQIAIPQDMRVTDTESREQLGFDSVGSFPRSAVLEAWIMLEDAAVRAIGARTNSTKLGWLRRKPNELPDSLTKLDLLDPDQVGLFKELRNLRNAAAHAIEMPLTDVEALDYVTTAASMAKLLETKAGTL